MDNPLVHEDTVMAAKREASIRVYLPSEVKEQFRLAALHKGITMSDIAFDLIERWLKENPPPVIQESKPLPKTFTELIRQNYFDLMASGKIKHMRLKDLSFGHKPNAKELQILQELLDIDIDTIRQLADKADE